MYHKKNCAKSCYSYHVNYLGDTTQNLWLGWTQHHITQHGCIKKIPNGLHIASSKKIYYMFTTISQVKLEKDGLFWNMANAFWNSQCKKSL